MSDFSPGQRWISDGEAELGLGTILSCDARSVTVLFGASQETRTYSSRQAPLTRVAFGSGDRIRAADGWSLTVDDSKEVDGLIVYIGESDRGELTELPEAQLADTMQFDQARDRLLTGQVDRNDWFDLRFRTLHHCHRVEQNSALGLAGPRIDLIPHQLYIADEVARRHAPRVLLADEVGLGKTIEAGLILHRLLLTGRAERALILVPASLTHQWLVELLRRFALEVTLLDEQQSQAHGTANPFETGQLVLASQDWLFANPHRQSQALACDWDLLIVDEAHHLDWSPAQVGPGYACVEQLAGHSDGVLLLTATPEQMGLESHFARLRLLDPDRYHSLDAFREEEAHYVAVAEAIEALERLPGTAADRERVTAVVAEPDSLALLDTLANPESSAAQQASARDRLREQLLDRHGTGRVMFRNSRRHVGGFPERRLHVSELEPPSAYRRVLRKLERDEDYLDELLIETGLDHPDVLIYPDAMYRALTDDPLNAEPWWQIDPRVSWLLERLSDDSGSGFAGDKVLVIAHGRETAQGLAEALRVLGGFHAPVFHEGLSLVERDRAAAAFADEESGCQVLVCSEIGSEGRNFQFCRHLVMFDLPQHPDQLEQRIGRLDRIGQRHAIEIHVPLFAASPGARLLRWYREGMDAFSAPHGLGNELFDAFGDAMADALLDDESLDEVIAETRALFDSRRTERDAGRNRLLELNACRHERADAVAAAIRALDEDRALPRYLEQALDIFGVDSRELGGGPSSVERRDGNDSSARKAPNTDGQALLAKRMGKPRVIAETGAGQHGVATATVAARLGLDCQVYMGAEDVQRQSLNVYRMKLLGAEVVPVTSGSRTLKDAMNEAMRDWVSNVDHTHYIIGTVAGPDPYPRLVRDFQAVIGEETRAQCLEQLGRLPDVLVACVGGGSNAIGLFHPFIDDRAVRLVGVEAGGLGIASGRHAAPLNAGRVGVLHGNRTYLMEDDDGQIIETHSISAGLDYPGVGPEHAHLKDIGRAEYDAVTDDEAMRAFRRLNRSEGILPALETSHALAWVEREAPKMTPEQVVVVNLSGRGDKDILTVARLDGIEL